jgi:hypothetical protein
MHYCLTMFFFACKIIQIFNIFMMIQEKNSPEKVSPEKQTNIGILSSSLDVINSYEESLFHRIEMLEVGTGDKIKDKIKETLDLIKSNGFCFPDNFKFAELGPFTDEQTNESYTVRHYLNNNRLAKARLVPSKDGHSQSILEEDLGPEAWTKYGPTLPGEYINKVQEIERDKSSIK